MKKQRSGFILVVCLIFLVVITLLGIFMFGGFTKDQQMAANYREKARAVDVAQSALDYAENWLSQPGNAYFGGGAAWQTGVTCSGVSKSTTPTICSDALSNPTTLPWTSTSYMDFAPTELTVATGQANSYASKAGLYLQYLGQTSTNPPTALYKATATATGGNSSAVTVAQEVLEVKATSIDISQ